jgi:hypothetical protein
LSTIAHFRVPVVDQGKSFGWFCRIAGQISRKCSATEKARSPKQIDDWHRARKGKPAEAEYQAFLTEIDIWSLNLHLTITTKNVDPKFATMPTFRPRSIVLYSNAANALGVFTHTAALDAAPAVKQDPVRG